MTYSLHICGEAVQAGVAKVLASQTFARSEKLRSFLAYVVEKEQSGAAQALKGYSIGVDVFGRPEEFDPSSDPLVRVQAGKLRKLLDRYYETEGIDDPVRISIPTGGYVPQYQINRRECPPPETVLTRIPADDGAPLAPAEPPRKPSKLRKLAYFSITGLNIALAAFNIGNLAPASPAAPLSLHSGPGLPNIGIPRVVVDADGVSMPTAKAIGEAIREAGNREAAVEVVSAEDERQVNNGGGDERLKFRVAVKPGSRQGSLDMSLVHDASGAIIYQVSYDLRENTPSGQLEAIALDLVSSTLPVSGEIYRFAAQQGFSSDLMQCMSLTELYNNTNARLAFINATACQSKLVPDRRPGSIYSNLRMLRDVSRSNFRHSKA